MPFARHSLSWAETVAKPSASRMMWPNAASPCGARIVVRHTVHG